MTTQKRWMQAHDARARKRREDLQLVLWTIAGLLVLIGATFIPGPMPS